MKRMLRLPAVLNRVPLGRTQLYQLMSEGLFPKPSKIGKRAVAWDEVEIDRWQKRRQRERKP